MQHVVADFHFFKIEITYDVADDLIADGALICKTNEMLTLGREGMQKNLSLLARH